MTMHQRGRGHALSDNSASSPWENTAAVKKKTNVSPIRKSIEKITHLINFAWKKTVINSSVCCENQCFFSKDFDYINVPLIKSVTIFSVLVYCRRSVFLDYTLIICLHVDLFWSESGLVWKNNSIGGWSFQQLFTFSSSGLKQTHFLQFGPRRVELIIKSAKQPKALFCSRADKRWPLVEFWGNRS